MIGYFEKIGNAIREEIGWESILLCGGDTKQAKNGWTKVTFYFKQDEL